MHSQNTVLIIDDELDSCLLWKAFLSQLKFTVHTALTLTEGMKLVDSIKPDIIFLDNNLPDGLGWEQVGVIRSKLPACKINLVSAFQFEAHKWIQENVKVIEKPITLSHIKTLLV
jgi:two-component system, OmpR family, response regulator